MITLVITPVVYSFFDDLRGAPHRMLGWRPRLPLGWRLEEALNGRWR